MSVHHLQGHTLNAKIHQVGPDESHRLSKLCPYESFTWDHGQKVCRYRSSSDKVCIFVQHLLKYSSGWVWTTHLILCKCCTNLTGFFNVTVWDYFTEVPTANVHMEVIKPDQLWTLTVFTTSSHSSISTPTHDPLCRSGAEQSRTVCYSMTCMHAF